MDRRLTNGRFLRFAPVKNHDCGRLGQGASAGHSSGLTDSTAWGKNGGKPSAPVAFSDWGKLGQTGANEGRCPSGIYKPLKGFYITTTGAAFGPEFELGQVDTLSKGGAR